jgi:hypothetical protein
MTETSGSAGSVVCLDQSAPSLALASEKARKHNVSHLVETLELDLNELDPSVHGTFDYIVSSGVLHHQPSPERGLAAVRAVLRPGGTMGIMMHASYGMGSTIEVHTALQRSFAQTDVGPRDRLETARALQRTLSGAVPPSLHHNLELNLASDEASADFFLVPYNRAYTVRQVASWLATAGLCLGRLEPSWRYDLEGVLSAEHSSPLHLARLHESPHLSRLDRISLADTYFGAAINHRFLARVAASELERADGVCDDEHRREQKRDPTNPRFAPVWMWPAMHEALPHMLTISNRTERVQSALQLLMPGQFGHAAPDTLEGALRAIPLLIVAQLEVELDAFPEDAATLAELADGCTPLSTLLTATSGRQRPDARDLRMYRTLERFFGLRLAQISDDPYCAAQRSPSS